MKKIKIITSIKPDKHNRGGPSGLIWECIEIFKAQNIDYTIDIIENKSFLNKLGIYLKKHSEIDKSDMVLVYPFNLFFCLDNKLLGQGRKSELYFYDVIYAIVDWSCF